MAAFKLYEQEQDEDKRSQMERQLWEMYEEFLDQETTTDRERISSQIHNIEVKLMRFEKSKCAVSNPGGYHEVSIRELANIR